MSGCEVLIQEVDVSKDSPMENSRSSLLEEFEEQLPVIDKIFEEGDYSYVPDGYAVRPDIKMTSYALINETEGEQACVFRLTRNLTAGSISSEVIEAQYSEYSVFLQLDYIDDGFLLSFSPRPTVIVSCEDKEENNLSKKGKAEKISPVYPYAIKMLKDLSSARRVSAEEYKDFPLESRKTNEENYSPKETFMIQLQESSQTLNELFSTENENTTVHKYYGYAPNSKGEIGSLFSISRQVGNGKYTLSCQEKVVPNDVTKCNIEIDYPNKEFTISLKLNNITPWNDVNEKSSDLDTGEALSFLIGTNFLGDLERSTEISEEEYNKYVKEQEL